jgi:hypothetical protein
MTPPRFYFDHRYARTSKKPAAISLGFEHRCYRRLTLSFGFPGLRGTAGETLRNHPSLSQHFIDQDFGRVFVFDNLIFDILGMALVALCLAVVLVPSRRPPGRCIRDF